MPPVDEISEVVQAFYTIARGQRRNRALANHPRNISSDIDKARIFRKRGMKMIPSFWIHALRIGERCEIKRDQSWQ